MWKSSRVAPVTISRSSTSWFDSSWELCLVEVPRLREVVQLPQCRGALLLQLSGEKVDCVDRLEQLLRPADGFRAARRGPVAVHPDAFLIVVLDVALRPGGYLETRNVTLLELPVEPVREFE